MTSLVESELPTEFKCNGDRLRFLENVKILLMLMLSVVIYAYIYFQVTEMIAKSKEMDRLNEITVDLNRRMNRLFELDHNMTVTLDNLRQSYTARIAIIKQAELCNPKE